MHKSSSDDTDNDPTDELPVLLAAAGLDEEEPLLTSQRKEDTAEHTALYSMAVDTAASAERLAELTAQLEQVPALEAHIRVLTDGTRELEQRIAVQDARLQELRESLAEQQRAKDETAAAERRLATQLALRDARIAELSATVERLEQETAAGSSELRGLRETLEVAQRQADALRQELAARPAAQPLPEVLDSQQLREDHAALMSYIAGRRAWWDEMQAANTRLAARVAALEHELATNAKRLAAAESFAAQESNRAVALRAQLVDSARRVSTLERELRLGEPPAVPRETDADAAEPAAAQEEQNSAPIAATAGDVEAAVVPPAQTPPVLTDAVEPAAPGVEALAQLEAEVEYKRQQVAAQLVELRDREQRLRTITSDLDQAHRELGTVRAELDDSRASSARLERAVIDKDRALEARDARIATLHEELKQRLGSDKRAPGEPSPALDVALPSRAAAREGDSMAAPALICLTGDAPKRFPLTKRTITIGRGPHCDLQVVTHFVSREHARLTLSGSSAFIEDLGSRNGVFVNSIRVDRQHLQQGDLLTIGETQFRFVESMAH